MPAGTPTATEPTLLARPAVLLEEDPDLGEGLDGTRREAALRDARTQAVVIPPGPWVQPEWPASIRSGAGLLILSGLLIRRVGLEHRHGAELLGAGDLLRPWQREDAASSLPRQAGWHVLERARIAILDARSCTAPATTRS